MSFVSQSAVHSSDQGELASTMATTAAAMSSRPLEAELLANSRNGARIRSIGAAGMPAAEAPPPSCWLAPTGATLTGRHHR